MRKKLFSCFIRYKSLCAMQSNKDMIKIEYPDASEMSRENASKRNDV
jgi:hypothetical protein